MRNLITIISLLFTLNVTAKMPKYLKGAIVTVTLKNGKTYTYKSEEYAVVLRKNLNTNALKVKGFNILHEKVVKKELVKNRKNRIYGLIGYGNNGNQEVTKSGDIYSVSSEEGSVLGAGYMRNLNEKINVGVQFQTNGTTSLTIGTDF